MFKEAKCLITFKQSEGLGDIYVYIYIIICSMSFKCRVQVRVIKCIHIKIEIYTILFFLYICNTQP